MPAQGRTRVCALPCLLTLAIVLVGCGGSDDDDGAPMSDTGADVPEDTADVGNDTDGGTDSGMDAEDTTDAGDTGDGGSDTADGGDTDVVVMPMPDPLTLLSPVDGDIVVGAMPALVRIGDDSIDAVRFTIDGTVGTAAPVELGENAVSVSFAGLDGEIDVVVEALAADESVVADAAVTVTSISDPPDTATIDADGGALETDAGVVVVIPPGAVDGPTDLLVRDRNLNTLPDVFDDPRLIPEMAIDLLSGEGTIDPSVEFRYPVRISWPYTAAIRRTGTSARRTRWLYRADSSSRSAESSSRTTAPSPGWPRPPRSTTSST